MIKDRLGDRMKAYERVNRTYLPRRMPLIIRIDGKAFHSYTRGLVRPFDAVLMKSMHETARYLCKNIEGCRLAYTQSDEISLLLTDYETFGTQPWFDKNLQKIVSVASSMATAAFNKAFRAAVYEWEEDNLPDWFDGNPHEDIDPNLLKLSRIYSSKFDGAMFDARAFILPKEEVCNYFIWRQQDASRNSVQMVGRAYFSSKELHKKCNEDVRDMLYQYRGVNWDDLPTPQKRGVCIIREKYQKDGADRSRWIVDNDIPVFTQDRDYIDRYVRCDECHGS